MTDAEVKAKLAILEKIKHLATTTNSPGTVLQLAEAWAWIVTPNNSHGGGAAQSS